MGSEVNIMLISGLKAAEYIGVSYRTFLRWRKTGKVPDPVRKITPKLYLFDSQALRALRALKK